MLTEYISEALDRARYELIEDDDAPYYGEVPELPGVWACGRTLEVVPARAEGCRGGLDSAQREAVAGYSGIGRRGNHGGGREGGIMASLSPVSHRDLVRRLRKVGFEGPFAGGKHLYMIKDEKSSCHSKSPRGDIGPALLARILKQAMRTGTVGQPRTRPELRSACVFVKPPEESAGQR